MGPGPRSRGRGGPRGGGGARGGARGGGRGGAMRGRGRGRGRGAPRGRGRAMRFDSQRLAAKEEAEDESEDESPSEEEVSEIEESESESESESEKKKEAYRNLMKSFENRAAAGPAAKRRKLANGAAEDVAAGEDEEDHDDVHDQQDDSDDGSNGDEADNAEENDDGEGKDVDYMDEDDDDDGEDGGFGLGDDDDDDEKVDNTDPFESHYSAPDLKDVELRLEAVQGDRWATLKTKVSDTRQVYTLPQTDAADSFSPPAAVKTPQQLKLKKRLADINTKPFGTVEQTVAPLLFNYYDTLFCERTPQNGEALRRLASLHVVNHVFKTRDRVLKNNEKLARIAKKKEEASETAAAAADDDVMDDEEDGAYRDQGYNRPKVLILLPTRQSCARMVDAICAVYQPEQQENRKRFDEAYVDKDATIPADRPADFRDLFDGNDDDMFRLGLKFTRKTVKYFSQFYNSDIILASPLGLRMAMGSEDTLATSLAASKRKGSKPKTDYDFLSSIEVVLLDQADALLMQNWEHVEHIFSHLNLLPRDNHEYDISRLRSWYLDDRAKYYRQTVVLSAVHTPALAELFRRFCHNWAGRVRVQAGEYKGVVGRIGVRGVKQTFSRFDVASIEAEPDARFDYFTKAIVPTLIAKTRGSSGGSTAANRSSGVLVYIPSYLDFVRVRNWFATSVAVANVSFGAISEYASVPEASRAMSHFLTGRHRVLLYSERAHHFRRHQINGVRTVILYGLPENPTFYTEVTGGFLARSQRSQRLEPGQGAVRAMFSQYDAFRLERIVGSASVGQMLRERSDTFVFEEDRAF